MSTNSFERGQTFEILVPAPAAQVNDCPMRLEGSV
jgi:hypothetical protein